MKVMIETPEITELLEKLIEKLAAESLEERLDDTERTISIDIPDPIEIGLDISIVEPGDIDVAVYGIKEKLKRIIKTCNHLH